MSCQVKFCWGNYPTVSLVSSCRAKFGPSNIWVPIWCWLIINWNSHIPNLIVSFMRNISQSPSIWLGEWNGCKMCSIIKWKYIPKTIDSLNYYLRMREIWRTYIRFCRRLFFHRIQVGKMGPTLSSSCRKLPSLTCINKPWKPRVDKSIMQGKNSLGKVPCKTSNWEFTKMQIMTHAPHTHLLTSSRPLLMMQIYCKPPNSGLNPASPASHTMIRWRNALFGGQARLKQAFWPIETQTMKSYWPP